MHFGLRACLAAASLSLLAACATPSAPPARPRANPAGAGIVVVDPAVRVAESAACPADTAAPIGPRFASAATSALTNAGFKVTPADASPAYRASLDVDVDYCSEAGIVSGTTALVLARGDTVVWRGTATGDQARGETAASTLTELVDKMLDDPAVIATFGAR